MNFDFATAARILFGAGQRKQIAAAARTMGSRALLVTGRVSRLPSLDGVPFVVDGEPTVELVARGVATARGEGCDMVIACGGGSAIDAGKAIAGLLTNPGDILDYLEVVGRAQPMPNAAAPFIAVPTTAGTGSEVTRNAVLASPAHRVKASLRSPSMLPRLAVVDPELTLDLPPSLTASTGMDALTQLIEPYVSVRANAMTDLFCVRGIALCARSLRRAYTHGLDLDARTDMSMASLLGGLALANAGLGAVHGFAAPIGGMFDAPHGAVCAALLPHVTEANLHHAGGETLRRYEEVARLLTGSDGGLVAWLAALTRDLGIAPLRTYGLADEDVADVCAKAGAASSMKGNPVVLPMDELQAILRSAR